MRLPRVDRVKSKAEGDQHQRATSFKLVIVRQRVEEEKRTHPNRNTGISKEEQAPKR